MARRTGASNIQLKKLIVGLKTLSRKEKTPLWNLLAFELEKPTRSRREVNLSKIELYANDNDTIVVPGKVLSAGELKKKVHVAAFRFSESAKAKINKAGKALTLEELMKKNPSGKGVRVFG